MNPTELKQSPSPEATPSVVATAEDQEVKINVNTEEAGVLAPISTSGQYASQWEQIAGRVSSFLSELPDYLNSFFAEYRRPLVTVGLIVGGVVSVKLTLALLDAVNDIPLMAPVFELIGIAYSAWFVYRYLLQANTRKELADDISGLKEKVIGK